MPPFDRANQYQLLGRKLRIPGSNSLADLAQNVGQSGASVWLLLYAYVRPIALSLVLILPLTTAACAATSQETIEQTARNLYFQETDFSVDGQFLDFYREATERSGS